MTKPNTPLSKDERRQLNAKLKTLNVSTVRAVQDLLNSRPVEERERALLDWACYMRPNHPPTSQK